MHYSLITFPLLATLENSLLAVTQPLANYKWPTQLVRSGETNIQVFVQGAGPTVVILPSYGRDSGDDYNYFTNSLVDAGYLVLRPQPRGHL